jgi:hypothetical protein
MNSKKPLKANEPNVSIFTTLNFKWMIPDSLKKTGVSANMIRKIDEITLVLFGLRKSLIFFIVTK